MIEKRVGFVEGIYRRIYLCIVRESFIGIWEIPGGGVLAATRALSLERIGDRYCLGRPIGYLQEVYCLLKKPLNKVRLEDFLENGFIYFGEELEYCDKLWKASVALREYADLRSRGK